MELKTQSPVGKLNWFYSGKYWYVHKDKKEGKKYPSVGCGTTRDAAYLELKELLNRKDGGNEIETADWGLLEPQ